MVAFLDEDLPEDEKPKLNPQQALILSYQAMTFGLGTHFHCPPHFWDNMPADRVMLDYMIMRAANDKKAEMIERMKKDAERQMKKGQGNKGRPIRTTSDGETLHDFFELHNQKLMGDD
tara:strand:+ start:209 stop:562 length:354 start_codon:yes stop_codon:yes gene_type:complete